jgi:hypothetical protein
MEGLLYNEVRVTQVCEGAKPFFLRPGDVHTVSFILSRRGRGKAIWRCRRRPPAGGLGCTQILFSTTKNGGRGLKATKQQALQSDYQEAYQWKRF